MSLVLRNITGDEGQIELVGVRAVVGVFLRWNLERHGEEGPDSQPSWTLRGVLSYQKDSILRNDSMTKKVKIHMPRGSWYELVTYPTTRVSLEQERYVMDGVTLKAIA